MVIFKMNRGKLNRSKHRKDALLEAASAGQKLIAAIKSLHLPRFGACERFDIFRSKPLSSSQQRV
ncbi:MAG TPA: hypothetical protein VMH85_06160 [Terriglobales bacterium]|nr:hypothetical protein [Terriglobales bacterium]